ncbi:MAG: hypothetical protein H6822_01225 [Planctomycetaceae bacterium]|nr:hypothetical protein [Planctomycetales bacterium]MCB9920768.1 hypothetical protein [Planctomycetaceae bacterium]
MTTSPYAASSVEAPKDGHACEFRSTRRLVTALTVTFALLAVLTVAAVGYMFGLDYLVGRADLSFELEQGGDIGLTRSTLCMSLPTAASFAVRVIHAVYLRQEYKSKRHSCDGKIIHCMDSEKKAGCLSFDPGFLCAIE